MMRNMGFIKGRKNLALATQSPSHPVSQPALEQIPAIHQGAHFTIGDAALQHPKSAIGMDIFQTLRADGFYDRFHSLRNEVGRLDFVVLDIDDSETNNSSDCAVIVFSRGINKNPWNP